MRKAEFAIDTFPGLKLIGFTDNENSNGWACPYFEFEEANKLINAHKQLVKRRGLMKLMTNLFLK
jgi:hypothetical protein